MTGNPLKTAIRKVKNEYAQIRAFNKMDLEDIRTMNRNREELERERYFRLLLPKAEVAN